MNTNTPETPSAALAAVGAQYWIDEEEKLIMETDFSDFMVTFSEKAAARLGLNNHPVSIGYIE